MDVAVSRIRERKAKRGGATVILAPPEWVAWRNQACAQARAHGFLLPLSAKRRRYLEPDVRRVERGPSEVERYVANTQVIASGMDGVARSAGGGRCVLREGRYARVDSVEATVPEPFDSAGTGRALSLP